MREAQRRNERFNWVTLCYVISGMSSRFFAHAQHDMGRDRPRHPAALLGSSIARERPLIFYNNYTEEEKNTGLLASASFSCPS
jgi:hypothetical protein